MIVILFVLISTKFVFSDVNATCEIHVMDGTDFSAELFVAMMNSVVAYTDPLFHLRDNITALCGPVLKLLEGENFTEIIDTTLTYVKRFETVLPPLGDALERVATAVKDEFSLVNKLVMDALLPLVDSTLATVGKNMSKLASDTDVLIVGDLLSGGFFSQAVNTILLLGALTLFWFYFIRFWPTSEEISNGKAKITPKSLLTRFAAPAIPMTVTATFIFFAVCLPLLISQAASSHSSGSSWGNKWFVRDVGVVCFVFVGAFILMQLVIMAVWCALFGCEHWKKNRNNNIEDLLNGHAGSGLEDAAAAAALNEGDSDGVGSPPGEIGETPFSLNNTVE